MPNASSRFDAADMVSQSLSLPIRIATTGLSFTMLSRAPLRDVPYDTAFLATGSARPHDTLRRPLREATAERGDAEHPAAVRDRFVAAPRGRRVEDHAVRPIPKRVEAVDRVALRDLPG